MWYWKTAQVRQIGAAVGVVLCLGAAAAQPQLEHHRHPPGLPASGSAPVDTGPSLEILMPGNGDIVGRQLAVVLQTPADLGAMTMGAAKVGVHLHLDLGEGLTLMPTRQQLIDLGSNRYLFLFDLPAEPGRNTIKVYWADGEHRIIESSVRSVTVSVKP